MAPSVGSRRLDAIPRELSSRDWGVLRSVRDHRFLTTDHLRRLHFSGHRTASAGVRACVRALTRLHSLGLLARLPRAVGGLRAGSRAFVWTLGVVGDRLLRREAGEERPRQGRRFTEPSRTFLEHTLAIADLRVAVEEAARAGLLELDQVQTEPACWRKYVGPHGSPSVLKSDLALVTATDDYEDHWFIEIDLGSESLKTLVAKCAQYESYRASGREQAATGVFPLIVWVMPDEARRDRLAGEIAAARALTPRLYRVVTMPEVVGLLTGKPPPSEIGLMPESTPTNERRSS